MLQQILKDMYVDPEILAELDEQTKQTLFCKMREEQVRRWKDLDSSSETIDTDHLSTRNLRPSKRKKVEFLLDVEGAPWVWIMGEHPNDKTIEQILEEEVREVARKQAEEEAEQLRMQMETDLNSTTKLIENSNDEGVTKSYENDVNINNNNNNIAENIYCSVEEIRKNCMQGIGNNICNTKRDALQEISFNKPQNVLQRVAQWENRMMEERTTEIYHKIKTKKLQANKEAEAAQSQQEEYWIEQERKAKKAEMEMREIARRAREEHRRSALVKDDSPPALPPRNHITSLSHPPKPEFNVFYSKPPSKDAIFDWFQSSQINRLGLEHSSNEVAAWFHGLISRNEAEDLLKNKPTGSFLVRVSERIWGYAISYKDIDKCKHYLVDASNGHYQFLGDNQITHNTLNDLIRYHSAKPITTVGGELLGRPCNRNEPLLTILEGLVRAR